MRDALSVHIWLLHAYVRTYVFMYTYVIGATVRFECEHTYVYECVYVYTRCMYVCVYLCMMYT